MTKKTQRLIGADCRSLIAESQMLSSQIFLQCLAKANTRSREEAKEEEDVAAELTQTRRWSLTLSQAKPDCGKSVGQLCST